MLLGFPEPLDAVYVAVGQHHRVVDRVHDGPVDPADYGGLVPLSGGYLLGEAGDLGGAGGAALPSVEFVAAVAGFDD